MFSRAPLDNARTSLQNFQQPFLACGGLAQASGTSLVGLSQNEFLAAPLISLEAEREPFGRVLSKMAEKKKLKDPRLDILNETHVVLHVSDEVPRVIVGI